MALPLEGIRVLDMAQVFAGPGAAMHLADQGAEVIKVEPPGGDGCRDLYTSPALGKMSKPFLALNRNKRGIVVDVSKKAGQGIVHKLAKASDVLIINLRPQVAERLRMDWATISGINPRLIYASISAFGHQGPDTHRPGYDLVLQGRAGILGARRMPDGTPVAPSVMISDMSCAMMLSYAIMVALWEREKTRLGQRIDTSLLGQAIAMQAQQLVQVQGDASPIPGTYQSSLYSPYLCQDGEYIITVVLTDRQWVSMCRVMGLEHLTEDPAFATYSERTARNADLFEILGAVYLTRSRGEWIRLLTEAQVPCAPVADRADVFNDPQVLANDIIVSHAHPLVGQTNVVGIPFKLSGHAGRELFRRPAPRLGEHTEEVLLEMGYSRGEIAALAREAVVSI